MFFCLGILLIAFMFMFQAWVLVLHSSVSSVISDIKVVLGLRNRVVGSTQGYGCMVGAPQHSLKTKLGIPHEQAAAFQDRQLQKNKAWQGCGGHKNFQQQLHLFCVGA